ncbi:hypothetical protein ACVXHB_28555 [Escherichia coli]
MLALIVWQRPNLLLLDEPTNHLDLDMRQALTEALIEFEGALVVVSHDRHLLRSTTDNLYLVTIRKVEPFDGDLEDYQQWLSDVQKQENRTDEAPKENANSAQARKDRKRREAELRAQTQPLRKEIARLEKEMEKLNAQLAQAEEKLGDSGLYDQSRKAELTACLHSKPAPNPAWKSAKWHGWKPRSSRADAAGRPKQLMAQITTTDANEFSSSAEFIPMRGFSNCHLQTMLPRLFRRQVKLPRTGSGWSCPTAICRSAWSENPAQAQHKPRLVVFHGLEGSLNSPYAHGLVEAAQSAAGWAW